MSSFALLWLLYIVPSLILLVIINYMSFYKEPGSGTIGHYLGITLMAIFPILNIIICLMILMSSADYYINKSKTVEKFRQWLDKPLPTFKRK